MATVEPHCMRTAAVRSAAALAVCLALGVLPGPAAALALGPDDTRPQGHHKIDREKDCFEAVPVSRSPAGATGGGAAISLDATVLLDGIDRVKGKEIMTRAASSYSPLRIALTSTYKKVAFAADGEVTAPDGSKVPSGSVKALIKEAKDGFGGVRPAGSDVVYILTNKDVHLDGDYDTVGYADCIGGVRYPSSAFAVGEGTGQVFTSFGLFNFYIDAAAKVAAHEIGHLFGAHHHYANCVQGIQTQDAANREPSACTLMTNILDFTSLNFGTLEAIVVRGHAEDFARP